jgi:hypothetical protein
MAVIEDYPKLTMSAVRQVLGGRKKMQTLNMVTFRLPKGRVIIELVRVPSSIGKGGKITYFRCPVCKQKGWVLWVVDNGVICGECLQSRGIKYSSQLRAKDADKYVMDVTHLFLSRGSTPTEILVKEEA